MCLSYSSLQIFLKTPQNCLMNAAFSQSCVDVLPVEMGSLGEPLHILIASQLQVVLGAGHSHSKEPMIGQNTV